MTLNGVMAVILRYFANSVVLAVKYVTVAEVWPTRELKCSPNNVFFGNT